jgi:hypothetical protein
MRKLIVTSVVIVALFVGVAAMTPFWSCEIPEPCSPGYWKNHPEDWELCGQDPGLLMSKLRARGPGSVIDRTWAADHLNGCYYGIHGTLPCDD